MIRSAHATLAVSLLCLTTAFAPALQERTKQKEQAKTFPVHLTEASAAWDAGRLGAASEALQGALELVNKARHAAVLAAFPEMGEGWTFDPSRYDENAAIMVMGMAGFMVEGSYRGPDSERLSITASMDSPMVQMLAPAMANPAFLGENAEIIKYGDRKALLEKNGDERWELTVLLGAHAIQVNARGMTDDELLSVMSQAAIDGFEAAMSR